MRHSNALWGVILLLAILLVAPVMASVASLYSDNFTDSNLNTTKWGNGTSNNGTTIEYDGYVSVNQPIVDGLNTTWLYSKYDYKDGKSYQINITVNISTSGGTRSASINICNKTTGIVQDDVYGTSNDCKRLIWKISSNLLTTNFTISINATSGNASLYNVEGSLNSTINITGLNKYYVVFGAFGTASNVTINLMNYAIQKEIDLILPANNVMLVNKQVDFNCSMDGMGSVSNLSLYINGDRNYTQFGSGDSLFLNATVLLANGYYNWTCEGRLDDNTLISRPSYRYFNLTDFAIDSQTYNATTYETSNETFILNISFDNSAIDNSYLVYNGTSYLAYISGTGNSRTLTRTLTIPSVATSGTNVSFYWNVNLINSTGTYSFNSTPYNQTILKGSSLSVGICPAGFSPALNFSLNYEVNRTSTNGTINYYLAYGLSGNNMANTINSTITNVNSFAICINNSQTYYDVGYGEIQYSVTGMSDRRYYIFTGTRLTNTTINIPLYSLDTPLSTSFLITAQSSSLVPYVNYYVGLLRWYPEINSYKVVDMGKTDGQGQTVIRVKTEDVSYRLALYSPTGTLIKLLEPIQLVCQTNPCVYSIFVDVTPLDLTTFTGIESSLTFNYTTNIFKFIWNDPSQATQIMNLTVYKDAGISSDIICSSSSSGYTGVLICDVTGYTGNLRAEATRTASPLTLIRQLLITIRQTFIDVGGGAIGLFFGALLVIFLALAGSFSPIIAILLGVVALIPLLLLGNITLGAFAIVGIIGGIIWFIISKN